MITIKEKVTETIQERGALVHKVLYPLKGLRIKAYNKFRTKDINESYNSKEDTYTIGLKFFHPIVWILVLLGLILIVCSIVWVGLCSMWKEGIEEFKEFIDCVFKPEKFEK